MNLREAQAFIQQLRQLPPERIAEVASYVDFLVARMHAGRNAAVVAIAPGDDALSGAQMAQIDVEMQASRASPPVRGR